MQSKGFTLIEIVIAVSGLIVLSIASTNFLFSILSQRDQAIAEEMAVDQAEIIYALLADKVRSAKIITVSPDKKSLGLKTADQCWLVVVDPDSQGLYFNLSAGSGCVIPGTADKRLTSQRAAITDADFSLDTSDDSSRTIRFNWTVMVARPLWQTTQTYQQLFVNVVDQGGQ